ncbi:sigma-54 factor interaction domain-containing protein, partial [bacterium]|nr:sigma-54 factor interaction domain-containing protein [bacterium]
MTHDNSQIARLIGISKYTEILRETILDCAKGETSILIQGPCGSGKEFVARLIHELSKRPGDFFVINCPAIPDDLLESELFGYVKGAFATRDRKGLLCSADNGTLFLDAVDKCSIPFQRKLLRFLDSGEVTPLGCNRSIRIRTSLISSSTATVDSCVANGTLLTEFVTKIK